MANQNGAHQTLTLKSVLKSCYREVSTTKVPEPKSPIRFLCDSRKHDTTEPTQGDRYLFVREILCNQRDAIGDRMIVLLYSKCNQSTVSKEAVSHILYTSNTCKITPTTLARLLPI